MTKDLESTGLRSRERSFFLITFGEAWDAAAKNLKKFLCMK